MGEAMIRGRRTRINYAKDWEYTTNDTATLVTKYIGNKTDVVVPSKINGKPVVLKQSTARRNAYISSFDTTGAFINNKNIVSVKFSEGVEIENNNMGFMFWNCSNLKSGPIIPINVTNMINTFQDCVSFINTPTVPSNVTDMGSTFYNCFNLVNAPTIPANVTNMSSTFQGCYNIINAPNIPDSVIFLGSTFQGCNNITNAPVIPANVNTISFAFSGCTKLTGNVYIKSNRIANDRIYSCFSGTTLPKNVYIPSQGYNATANTWNAAFNTTYGINGKNGVTVIDDAVLDFEYTTNDTTALVTKYIGSKTDVVVPSTLSGKKVVLQNSATSQTGVFTNNRNIKSVKFSEGVSIANNNMDYAFYYCNRLVNTPVIPANVTDMRCTFYNCTNLVNAPEIPANITDMSRTFSDCRNLINAPVIPANVTSMYQTFSNCTNLTGNIHITSNRINNTSMKNCFNGTTLPKNVYIPSQGYNAVANTWNAAFNTTYGINGKNGVTVMDEAALDWTYTTNDTATLLTKYTGDKADVVVPAALAAKPTMLSTAVFEGTNVNSVDLGGVNFANLNMANAFNGCTNLKSVKNTSVYINQANDAFHGCTNLTGVYAQNVTGGYEGSLGEIHNAVNMFRNCYNMTRVANFDCLYADSTNIANYSHMFENCSNLASYDCDFMGATFVDGGTADISYMFANCQNLTWSTSFGYTLLGNVNASHSFDNTGFKYLGQITDPNFLEATSKLGMGFANLNASYMFANCKNMIVADFGAAGTAGTGSANFTYAFNNCQNLTDVRNIPNGIALANFMFANCRKLVNISPMQKGLLGAHDMCQNCVSLKNAVEIPDTVTSMWGIYRNCSNLVNVPLTAISLNATDMDSAFYGCTNLVTAPIIPPNITDLRNAFNGCTNLTGNVAIYTNKLTTYASVFSGTTKAKNVYIYNTNTTSNMWNVWNNTTSGVNGKNGVALINMGTWENACWTYTTSGTNTLVTKYKGTPNEVFVPKVMNGRNVVLQNSAGSTSGVFTGNSSIKRVKFENGVNITNDNMGYAFYTCYNLVSAPTIPANVTNMCRTFYACENLISAPTIPVKVTNIEATFGVCRNLVSAPAIPNNVTDMYGAFDSCYSFKSVPAIPTNVTNIGSAFSSCRNLVSAPAIPASVTDMGATFSGCNNLVSAPDMSNAVNVTNMCYTFYNCTNLVNAPNMSNAKNVTNMVNTFLNCVNLTRGIRIGSNRINNTSMQNCFYGTTKAKNVYVPFTGYSATANTHNAAINATYGISGKNGVTIYDINTYKG